MTGRAASTSAMVVRPPVSLATAVSRCRSALENNQAPGLLPAKACMARWNGFGLGKV